MRALARNGRGQGGSSGGRLRAFVADPSCPCCDGCPSWRLLAVCDTSPRCDGSPPPVLSAWICTSVTCLDGSPIGIGQRIAVDGLCWTAQIQTQPVPPPDSYIIEGLEPVQCVDDCYDEACPQPQSFIRSQPCNSQQFPIYVCGVTECNIYGLAQYGCHLVDPASGYIPGNELPPGAVVFNASGSQTYGNCCDCAPILGCSSSPMSDPVFNQSGCTDQPPCYSFPQTCCCESDLQTGAYLGRVRIVEATQTRIDTYDPGFGTNGAFYGYLGAQTIDPVSRNACYERFIRREGFGGPTEVNQLPDLCFADECGWTWWTGFGGHRGLFDGSISRVQCRDCSFGAAGYIDNVSIAVNITCTSYSLVNTYTIHDIQNHITSVQSIVLRMRIDGGGSCAGECIGRGVSAQRRAATGAGCSGCNKNTTRIA